MLLIFPGEYHYLRVGTENKYVAVGLWPDTIRYTTGKSLRACRRKACPVKGCLPRNPASLSQSTTSVSRRRCTEVFPAGMTTRALLQKSAPRDSVSGASGLVWSSPRSRIALSWLWECLTMVDVSFMSARFLGTDDASESVTAQVYTTRKTSVSALSRAIQRTSPYSSRSSIRSRISLLKMSATVRNGFRA